MYKKNKRNLQKVYGAKCVRSDRKNNVKTNPIMIEK